MSDAQVRLTEQLPPSGCLPPGLGKASLHENSDGNASLGCSSGSSFEASTPGPLLQSPELRYKFFQKRKESQSSCGCSRQTAAVMSPWLTVQPALRPSGARPRPPSSVWQRRGGSPGTCLPACGVHSRCRRARRRAALPQGSEALASSRPPNLRSGIRANSIPGRAAWGPRGHRDKAMQRCIPLSERRPLHS